MYRYILTFLLSNLVSDWASAGDQVLILQYHHVDAETPPSTSLAPELFREHMLYLRDNGFTVVRLEEALSAIQNNEELPDKAVSITFDDAYVSVYEQAWPILDALDFPFTIFVTAALTGNTPGIYTSWEQLREMGKLHATLANHSMSHPYFIQQLENEMKSDWLERIRREILDAEDRIEANTGQRHGLLAWPFGEYNPTLQTLIEDLGYIGLAQQSGAVNQSSDFTALPRFPFSGLYASMESFPMRVDSLAFDVKAVLPRDRNTTTGNPVAHISLAPGDFSLSGLTCYHNNHVMNLETKREEDTIHITLKSEAVSLSRRFRYNCTARRNDGRYYWYSVDWVNPRIEE